MVIQHNLVAMYTNRQLGITTNAKNKSTEKLASGYKINRSADDAAGLAISEKLRRQIRGLRKGSQNVTDGISMVQTAEGALSEVHDMLQRMNELTVYGLNGTLTHSDRDNIQDEIDELYSEIGRVAESTEFNEIKVLKGDPIVTKIAPTEGITVKQTITAAAEAMPSSFVSIGGNMTLGGAAGATQPGNDGTSIKTVTETDANGNTTFKNVTNSQWSTGLGNNFGTTLDFSGLAAVSGTTSVTNEDGTTSNVSNLYVALQQFIGTGFYTTCATCNERYSVAFADGVHNFIFQGPNNAQTTQINLRDLLEESKTATTTADSQAITRKLVEKIANTQNNTWDIKDHYTRYATNGSNPYALYVYDFRDYVTDPASDLYGYVNQPDYSKGIGTFGNLQGFIVNLDVETFIRDIPYDAEEPINIQYGDDGDNNSKISLPRLMDIFNIYSKMGYPSIKDSLTLVRTTKNNNEPVRPAVAGTYTQETITVPPRKVDIVTRTPIYVNGELKGYHTEKTGEREEPGYTYTKNVFHPSDVSADAKTQQQEFSKALNYPMLDVIKSLIEQVSDIRSYLGAHQNRLEHALRNNANMEENTTASESRIRDTDMEKEMVSFANNNIIAQAGQSMLAQANQTNQGVLNILG